MTGKVAYAIGTRVTHSLFKGNLRVTRVKMFSDLPGREPEYELKDDSGQEYSDVCHGDLNALGQEPVLAQETPAPEPESTSPGWMYDADSGQPLGPASYELREKFEKNEHRPIETVFGACKHKITLKR